MRGVLFVLVLILLSSSNAVFADDLKVHGNIYPVIGDSSAQDCDAQEIKCRASCSGWYVSRCYAICEKIRSQCDNRSSENN
jgi:hypothetical protein